LDSDACREALPGRGLLALVHLTVGPPEVVTRWRPPPIAADARQCLLFGTPRSQITGGRAPYPRDSTQEIQQVVEFLLQGGEFPLLAGLIDIVSLVHVVNIRFFIQVLDHFGEDLFGIDVVSFDVLHGE